MRVLLDQNVPEEIARWPRGMRPSWSVHHAKEAGLAGCPDAEVFRWAQAKAAMVVTFDEDFADARSFPLGSHHGVVRLRVWPTTVEQTVEALTRLLTQVPEDHLPGSLIIIDRGRIRVRRRP